MSPAKLKSDFQSPALRPKMLPATARCWAWQLFSVKTISPGEAIRRRHIVFIENNPVADPAGDVAAA
jgi:hypothetical protein